MASSDSLADKVIEGDVRATAQLIRRVDDGDKSVFSDLAKLYGHSGRAYVIGFTGSPGVGKSTLVDRIIARFREDGKTVGVLAIDPTSPFSGGAILGDRIRMQRHFLDDGVFIRSLATRGKFGGLTRSTADAIVVLDAMGKDVIIVETVGVGQDEVDIVNSAHTSVVVTVPGMGDDIQAIKAGLMEIGDLFVVNKADREGAAKTVREIQFMLQMNPESRRSDGWETRVLECVATQQKGVEEVYIAILNHKRYLENQGKDRLRNLERNRVFGQFMDLFREGLFERALNKVGGQQALDKIIEDIVARKNDPYHASLESLNRVLGG
ncbi:MAG: methylmalonyl Co-A mutase-associated GTPase MeaB [Deltaproteobacteria bacterium]|nr:methylmalonyl Co-A mutase-associated GTPase MeaB [Deltaproteobacteria bacterium]